ncbi:reverse transcriptase [Elysia marginata]|uniref:Reverse transcriptase n=1 Tax=Elysia marginata TaxID=1093978 RepID=A0AAV4IB27_9GAST|nr:reverse transcriptase [Elysia marginata]
MSLKKTYSDTNRELPLKETAGLIWPAASGIKFNNKRSNLQEVVAVVNKARAKSAPGPNGVPYLLYKRCPNVLKRLHKILQSALNNIKLALRLYHVPEDIQVMLDDYFNGFRMRFSTSDYTTNWINLEMGDVMGCTISPILFVMAMEVILKAAEGSAVPANLGGGCAMPPLKAP